MANAVPVLCVARNVACSVRGGFFRFAIKCIGAISSFELYAAYCFNIDPVFIIFFQRV
jgi:hypothetical protein